MQVFVNGIQAGSHTGGYDAFSFDITELLKEELEEQELLVVVEDPTESQVCVTLPAYLPKMEFRLRAAGDTSWKAVGGWGATFWVYLLQTNFWHLAGSGYNCLYFVPSDQV